MHNFFKLFLKEESFRLCFKKSLNMAAFLSNFFLFCDLDKENSFFAIKTSLSILVLAFSFLSFKIGKAIPSVLILYRCEPLLDFLIFLNIEVPIYQKNQTISWVGFFRALSFLPELSHVIILKGSKKVSILIVLLILLSINFLFNMHLKNLEIVPALFEILLVISNILLSKTNNDNIRKSYTQNKEKNYLNFLHIGVIVLIKNQKGFLVEIQNEKAKKLLYDGEIQDFKSDFYGINNYFADFSIHQIKCSKKDQTLLNIESNSKDIQNLISSKKKFSDLSELLSFHDKIAKNNEIFHFNRLIKENIHKKYSHNLNMILYKENIDKNQSLYFIIIQKADTILDLREKNEIKSRLLNSISHELKTPLNGSIPILEILHDTPELDEKLKHSYIKNTLGCLKILDNTLSNILDYNLWISGQFILNISIIDLKELLQEVMKVIQPEILMKGLEFHLEADETIFEHTIRSDYNRLKQILLNILINAVQFTEKGEIILKITRHFGDLEFVINDTGIGMSAEQLNKLEAKLKFKIDDIHLNTTGSCLGLVVSNTLSLALGNTMLEFKSKENVGTSFKFHIINQKTQINLGEPEGPVIFSINDSHRILKNNISKPLENHSNLNDKKNIFHTFGGYTLNNLSQNQEEVSNKLEVGSILQLSQVSLSNFDLNDRLQNYQFENLIAEKNIPELNKKKFSIKRKYKTQFNHEDKVPKLKKSGTVDVPQIKFSKVGSPILSACKIEKSDKILGDFFLFETNIEKKENSPCHLGAQVLLVDDDPFNLLSLESLFKLFKVKSMKAMNGKEALNILKSRQKCLSENCKGKFQLVVLDYQMPVMNGIETMKEIKRMIEMKEINDVPVIGCTAFLTKTQILECFEAGMKDVVFKPLNKSNISKIVSNWLNRNSKRGSLI